MQFLYTLIILGTAVGAGSVVCHGAMREAVRGALGVVLVAAMIVPFLGAVSQLEDFNPPDFDVGGEGSFGEITSLAFEEGIKKAIADEFSVKGEIEVVVRDFSPSELRAGSITVVIPSSAVLVDFRAVREYTEKNFTRVGGCEVVYG